MEGKLLLLGILRGGDMYGYQINELIDTHMSSSVHLTKPTAYRFLNKMAEDGWVSSHEEREGNRPPRRVFSITAKGESVFQETLRTCLADFSPAEHQSTTCMAFLDQVDAGEAIPLLEERKKKIESMLQAAVEDTSHQMGSVQLVIERHIRYLKTELSWLGDVINQLEENQS